MTLPLKTGLFAAGAAALLLAAPLAPASAAPMGLTPGNLVRPDSPIDHVRYRRHTAQRGYYAAPRRYVVRRAYVGRHYGHRRYGYRYNPGAAIVSGVLGTVAGAAAYNYYDPGYSYYPAYNYGYSYPAYSYGYSYPAYSYPSYPAYYGGGWGGGGWNGGWGW